MSDDKFDPTTDPSPSNQPAANQPPADHRPEDTPHARASHSPERPSPEPPRPSKTDDGMTLETIRIQLVRPSTGSRLRVSSSVRAKTPMRRLFENYQELLAALYPGWDVESISRFRSVPHS